MNSSPASEIGEFLLFALLAVGVIIGLRWWWVRVGRPGRVLRAAVRDLADGRLVETAALLRVQGPWQSVAGDLAQAGERMREMMSQLDDETLNLHTILESLTEGVLIVDVGQIIHSVNGPLERMFELKSSPLGRSVLEVFRDGEVRAAMAKAITGEPTIREITLETRGADGRYAPKHFDLATVGLRPAGAEKPVGAIAVFHDISALKALESVRREFVANISHELRTPLSIINGYLETLLDAGTLDDRAMTVRALNVMQKHGQRLNLLVEDLLTIATFEHGRAGLNFSPVSLAGSLRKVVERLDPAIAEKRARVEIAIDPDAIVEADPDRLDQVFFNLLENALKYGPSSGLVVRLTAEVGADAVAVTVEDNGPGIPNSDLPHIFERFYRVHKDRSRDAGGTGLGLSIVKHIVQAHGGHVTVESDLGRGASFRVRLPRSRGAVAGGASQ
jgi:two-component system, OmpR family, phosphate regulon sensor histidine kinase PhoR